jgi:phospholipid/cholesterol/gamma-HCH transport system permease protein
MSTPATTLSHASPGFIQSVGAACISGVCLAGDLAIFFGEMLLWLITRLPRASVVFPMLYSIGLSSLPMVLMTGGFIGIIIAVQTYDQFRFMHLEANMGATINLSLVRELGPVLTATMLAGRIGGAIAAELGTMKITEQIDALRVLGANPVQHLVVPRFLACVLMIPLLALFADAAGILGGWFLGSQILGVNNLHYWNHSEAVVGAFDIFTGVAKCAFFGAAIAIVSCHRGFNCRAGAEGVGLAATEAFVISFGCILVLDFLLGVILTEVYRLLFPGMNVF